MVREENEPFSIRVWKPLPSRHVFEGKPGRESPKRIISTSGGLEPLQMVSEPGTEGCASEDVGPPRGVDCEISHQLERKTNPSLSRYGNLSLADLF